jgi:amicoumacin kinase
MDIFDFSGPRNETELRRPLPFSLQFPKDLARLWRPNAMLGPNLGSYENFVFDVFTEQEVGVLRIAERDRRSREEIYAEISLLSYLRQCQQVVPRPFAFSNGTLVLSCDSEIGSYSACVFEKIPGRHTNPSEVVSDNIFVERWGQLIGSLHRDVSRYGAPEHAVIRRRDNRASLAGYKNLLSGSPYCHEVGRVIKDIAETVPKPEDLGIVHADLQGSNILILNSGEFAIIDFDDCCFHWYCYDLAVALNWLFQNSGRYSEIRESIVRGYERAFALSSSAKLLLEKFVLAHSALQYELTRRRLSEQPDSFPLTQRLSRIEHALQWQIDNLL